MGIRSPHILDPTGIIYTFELKDLGVNPVATLTVPSDSGYLRLLPPSEPAYHIQPGPKNTARLPERPVISVSSSPKIFSYHCRVEEGD